MNSWSRTRKRIILGIVLFFVIVLVGVPFYLLFYEKPNCFDKKQNGDETGVDCGGSCQMLCRAESLPLIVKGDARILTVADNVYEVAALIDNPNADAEIYRARYDIKIYGTDNSIPIKTLTGEAFVPKGKTFALFEGPFTLEKGVFPSRATLEWQKDTLVWRKNSSPMPEVTVEETALTRETASPRLEALVRNLSLESVSNIDLVAIISDENGNIFAASKTYIDALDPGAEAPVVWTWPRPFGQTAADIKVFTRIFPDSSFIR